MQGCITSLQEGQLVEEEADVPFSQLVVGRLADQTEASPGHGIGDAGQLTVFSQEVLIAEF